MTSFFYGMTHPLDTMIKDVVSFTDLPVCVTFLKHLLPSLPSAITEYLRSISLPVPVLVEDTSSSSEYGSVSPDTELKVDPFSFKTRAKSCGEKDGKGIRTLFLG